MTKEVSFGQSIDILFPTRELWSLSQVTRLHELEIYTDGSKTELGTGAGVFSEELHLLKSVKLDPSCTVFQAEVLAIIMAADAICENNIRSREITLYVDSQAAIRSLGNSFVNSKLVKECRSKIVLDSQHNSLRVCWIPGHSNYKGNEVADRLAKLGSDDTVLVISNIAKPPLGYIEGKIDSKLLSEWQHYWESVAGCHTFKLFWPMANLSRTKEFLYTNKLFTKVLKQFSRDIAYWVSMPRPLVPMTADFVLGCKEDIIHLLYECMKFYIL